MVVSIIFPDSWKEYRGDGVHFKEDTWRSQVRAVPGEPASWRSYMPGPMLGNWNYGA
jgi:hypothetical protein